MTRPATRSIGAPGIGLVVLGAVLVLLSFTTLSWYSGSHEADSVGDITFNLLHHLRNDPTLTHAYFTWLSWVLLLAGIAVGFTANFPTEVATPLRMASIVLGVAGAVLTYLSLHSLTSVAHRGVFDHAGPGIYATMAGFVVIGLGGAVGPLPSRES
jgi:uncharacterized membrane protein